MNAVEILFLVDMFLWGLSALPAAAPYASVRPILAWIAVALLGFHDFVGR